MMFNRVGVAGLIGLVAVMGSFTGMAMAQEAVTSRKILVKEVQGDAFFQLPGTSVWKPLTVGATLSEADKIKTEVNGSVSLVAQGQSDAAISIKPNSEVELSSVAADDSGDKTLIDLQIGSVLVKAEKLQGASQFQVRTPSSIVGIRGTEFEVSVE